VGFVPFDAMPHQENPDSGVLVNANNRVQAAGAEPYLGRDWFGDWRFRRIHQLLAQREREAPGDMAAMQRDTLSLFAQEMLPVLRRLPRPEGPAGAARDLLLGWDGQMGAEMPQPLIFNAWWPNAARMALRNGGVPEDAWPATPEFLRFVLAPDGRGAHWCRPAREAPAAGQAEGDACAALAAQALEDTVAQLSAAYGPDPAEWRWGAAHQARFEHPLLRFIPVLRDWTRISAPRAGDGETVDRATAGRNFDNIQGPGLRAVFDLGAPEGAFAIIGTGQSGNPLSGHWSDQTPIWAGRGPDGAPLLPLGAVPARSGGVLRLEAE